ncbi:hypothetical protein RYZ27_13585 [Hyphomonas sp. FCG-A18]|uniref:hypothetical protein n=1 Tax=Hyphomonas sp. FCG-A18 TaxID=3080019 RepID=UPI002B2B47D5|nr:hypothetical protein RYZ27_13585 [Hyphomonas sp. FCG-A18]
MESTPTLVQYLTLTAAVIAAVATLLNYAQTGWHKVATNRIDWIERLRSRITDVVTLMVKLEHSKSDTYPDGDPKVGRELYQSVIYVTLLLNPKEHKELLEVLHQVAEIDEPMPSRQASAMDLVWRTQLVLRHEWLKSKAELKNWWKRKPKFLSRSWHQEAWALANEIEGKK